MRFGAHLDSPEEKEFERDEAGSFPDYVACGRLSTVAAMTSRAPLLLLCSLSVNLFRPHRAARRLEHTTGEQISCYGSEPVSSPILPHWSSLNTSEGDLVSINGVNIAALVLIFHTMMLFRVGSMDSETGGAGFPKVRDS